MLVELVSIKVGSQRLRQLVPDEGAHSSEIPSLSLGSRLRVQPLGPRPKIKENDGVM